MSHSHAVTLSCLVDASLTVQSCERVEIGADISEPSIAFARGDNRIVEGL